MSEISDIDRKIMRVMAKNSRIANTDIAKSIGISESTVRKRIRKLEEEGVMRNISIFNPGTLGYQIHVHIGIQVEYKKITDVAQKLKEKESVFFVGYSTGRYDIIIVAFFYSPEEQYRFLVDEIASIDGIIKIETSNILKMVKSRHVWGITLPEE